MTLEELPRVPTPAEIGRALAEARRDKGMTQEELAKEARVTRAAVSRVERGQMNPSATVLLALGLAVGMAVFARNLARIVGPVMVAGLAVGGALGAVAVSEVAGQAARTGSGPKSVRRMP